MIDEINRLGFEAWADNKIVNFLEDHGSKIASSQQGYMSHEGKNFSITCTYVGEWINIVVRAHVADEGWKVHEWSIRRWKGVRGDASKA